MNINFCIPCLLGVEGLIADELRFLGAENVAAENGRVLFSGDENMLARVNICSHFAERVLNSILEMYNSYNGLSKKENKYNL